MTFSCVLVFCLKVTHLTVIWYVNASLRFEALSTMRSFLHAIIVWGYLKVSEDKAFLNFFFFEPPLVGKVSTWRKTPQSVCSPLSFGPAELFLYWEPELIKRVSTDLTEGMRACKTARYITQVCFLFRLSSFPSPMARIPVAFAHLLFFAPLYIVSIISHDSL